MHFPHASYAKDVQLAETFRFQEKVTGDDLVAYARNLQSGPEVAIFEETLEYLKHLLLPNIVTQLSDFAFLTSSQGGLAKPSNLYLNTALNDACLGAEAPYVSGRHSRLYKLLGCLDRPRATDIHKHLLELGRLGVEPDKPDVLYNELIEALRRENKPTSHYREEPILWVEKDYYSPKDTLISARHRRIFLDAVPQLSRLSSLLRRIYHALGAHIEPQEHHWLKLFQWFDVRYTKTGGLVTFEERASLRATYEELSEMPAGIDNTAKCLLDRTGMLHSLAEVRAHRFVIDDAPTIADALTTIEAPVYFADTAGERATRFYNAVGVVHLTEIQKKIGKNIGGERPAPKWFSQPRVIDRLHKSELASALSFLAARTLSREEHFKVPTTSLIEDKLQSLKRVLFVDKLEGVYKVIDTTVSVPTEIYLDGDAIVIPRAQSHHDIYDLLSLEVAGWFIEKHPEQRSLADAVFHLLLCNSTSEMKSYLKRRGIVWQFQLQEEMEIHDDSEIAMKDSDDLSEQIRIIVSESVLESLHQPSSSSDVRGQSIASETGQIASPKADTQPKKLELPLIRRVRPKVIISSSAWSPPERGGEGKGRSASTISISSVRRDHTRDAELGHRGEEIIYELEKERVKTSGYSESRVVWTANFDQDADHDILSVDADGEDLWIEVKSTSGRDGRFYWSKSEFEKAARERDRYVLYRVYEADTTTPSVKVFRDPVSLIARQAMRLDVANLYVEAEPLKT